MFDRLRRTAQRIIDSTKPATATAATATPAAPKTKRRFLTSDDFDEIDELSILNAPWPPVDDGTCSAWMRVH